MPDVGNGVIGFDHVRFHVRDLVMAFLELSCFLIFIMGKVDSTYPRPGLFLHTI
jgi:hypothetical protein